MWSIVKFLTEATMKQAYFSLFRVEVRNFLYATVAAEIAFLFAFLFKKEFKKVKKELRPIVEYS